MTNLTANTFVLASGVKLAAGVVAHPVADVLYQSDSSLNEQLDRLQSQGFISITGKPADPFPSAGVFRAVDLGVVSVSDVGPGEPFTLFTPGVGEYVIQTMSVLEEAGENAYIGLGVYIGDFEIQGAFLGGTVGDVVAAGRFSREPIVAYLDGNGHIPAFPLPLWQANHSYADQEMIRDSNGNMQTRVNSGGANSGGSEPTWAAVGQYTSDPHNELDPNPPSWQNLGAVLATTGKMHVYIVTAVF